MNDNFEFLAKFQRLQNEVEYDTLIDISGAKMAYTQSNPSPFQNYALVDHIPTEAERTTIEKECISRSRVPALYFENSPALQSGILELEGLGYHKEWEDSWMFYDSTAIDKGSFNQVKLVNTNEDLEVFLNTFDACYQKGDPQNPYGEVKDYIINCRRAWLKFKGTDRLKYFIVFSNNQPVATAALNNFEGLGYISAVGSLKQVRGRSFGKLATLYAVTYSQKLGNTEYVLATEEGTYPNEFYKRIGFKTRFTALGYTKK